MDNKNITDGVFDLGSNGDLQCYTPWLKAYYKDREWNYKFLKKHILARYACWIHNSTYQELFLMYVHHLMNTDELEYAKVVNDNDERKMIKGTINSSRRTRVPGDFPKVQQHPMASWRGERITKFGVVPAEEYLSRMAQVQEKD